MVNRNPSQNNRHYQMGADEWDWTCRARPGRSSRRRLRSPRHRWPAAAPPAWPRCRATHVHRPHPPAFAPHPLPQCGRGWGLSRSEPPAHGLDREGPHHDVRRAGRARASQWVEAYRRTAVGCWSTPACTRKNGRVDLSRSPARWAVVPVRHLRPSRHVRSGWRAANGSSYQGQSGTDMGLRRTERGSSELRKSEEPMPDKPTSLLGDFWPSYLVLCIRMMSRSSAHTLGTASI